MIKGIRTKTTQELKDLRKFHDNEVVKQFSIAKNADRHAKAEILSEMNQLVDMSKLNKKYCDKGVIATYHETGKVFRDNNEFYNELDVSELAEFVAQETGDKSKRIYFVNEWHKRLAYHNDLNPWKHIYNTFRDYVDAEMDKGNCFSNIICVLECNNKQAKEIADNYREKKMYHSKMVYIIDKELTRRGE